MLVGSDLTSKMEPAFLAGLRCKQPAIQQKFVEVFNDSVKTSIYDRLLYIICSQNWENMGSHFWIKQCIDVSGKVFSVLQIGCHSFLPTPKQHNHPHYPSILSANDERNV